jgi:hypothetical protein
MARTTCALSPSSSLLQRSACWWPKVELQSGGINLPLCGLPYACTVPQQAKSLKRYKRNAVPGSPVRPPPLDRESKSGTHLYKVQPSDSSDQPFATIHQFHLFSVFPEQPPDSPASPYLTSPYRRRRGTANAEFRIKPKVAEHKPTSSRAYRRHHSRDPCSPQLQTSDIACFWRRSSTDH